MTKFFNIFFLLSKTKFEFSLPKKCDILCYDQGKRFNNDIRKIFNKFKVNVIYIRLEKINFIIILKSIISKILDFKLSLKNHYIKNYYHQTQPKVILSSSYYDKSFLFIKKIIPNDCKIILVQRCPYKDTDFNTKKNKPKIDQTYLFNRRSQLMIKNYINSREFILGSFRNNFQKKNKKKNINILFISGYKKIFEDFSQENKENFLDTIHEKKLVRTILNNFSKKYKIKILLKSDVKKIDYLDFSEVDKRYVLLNDGNPYKFLDQSNLVITFNNGTMGHEAISRGIKNIQLPRKNKNDLIRFHIFQDGFNEIKINNFISHMIRMRDIVYFKKMKRFKKDIIFFDYKNSLLVRNVTKLIDQRK